jgi:hypothetical protein
MTRKFIIGYQYGQYSGERVIFAEDGESAISKLWRLFRNQGLLTLPMAVQKAWVVREEAYSDDDNF